uniref:Putative ovule protein n=1 Tax=Solanum chacoense TaxID=4108 RepID=A0A0V0IPE5_SOLCH
MLLLITQMLMFSTIYSIIRYESILSIIYITCSLRKLLLLRVVTGLIKVVGVVQDIYIKHIKNEI